MDSNGWKLVEDILGRNGLSMCGKRAIDSFFTTFGVTFFEKVEMVAKHAGRKEVHILI